MSENGHGGRQGMGATARLRVVRDVPRHDAELRVRSDPAELRKAREFAAAAAMAVGFDEEGRYQFMLATSEALANAIEHGAPFPDGMFRLRAVEEHGMLSLYVSDCGTSTWDVVDPDVLSTRGRGLGLVQLLMDEVELRPASDRTTVRLSKRVR